jgi:competence protein ComEA
LRDEAVVRIDDVPDLPFTRRQLLVGGVVALVLLIVAGRLLLHSGASASTPVPAPIVPTGTTAIAAGPVVVNVVGAVRRPGLYRLRDGSRIADAVARAGGVTPKAQVELVNLASRVSDGEQIVVPRRGAVAASAGGAGSAAAPAGPVHLNSATLEQLDALPGVGPVTAQKILAFREEHGAFASVDELDAIPGIGPARLEQLRDLVAP